MEICEFTLLRLERAPQARFSLVRENCGEHEEIGLLRPTIGGRSPQHFANGKISIPKGDDSFINRENTNFFSYLRTAFQNHRARSNDGTFNLQTRDVIIRYVTNYSS